jgi:putative nucleotidyltransferase with HDIG domain
MDKPELLSDLTYINTDLTEPVAPSGRRRRRYKIAWVLMAVLLLVGILPVYTVSSRLIELNKESLKTQQQVYQLQLATSLAHHMDSYVVGQQRTVTVLAEVLAGELASHSGDRFMAELSRRRTLSKYVDDDLALLRYTHRDGSSVTAMREGFAPDETMEVLLADEFAQQMNRGAGAEAVIGKPFYSAPLEGPAVFLSTPVLQDGRRVGAISALAGIAAIWKEAQGSSGYSLFALNAEGELFTEPGDGGAIAGVAYPELEIVREFIATGGSRVMPYVMRDDEGGAISLLGSYAQTRNGWGVFVQAEENKAYFLVEDMKWNTWFHATLAAIGAVIAGGLFAGWISRPIKRLADSSRAFADGDFHARVPVRSGHEVGVLAETFNVMAETLERYITRLKRAAQENSQLFIGSIRALAAAIDEKDAYTRGHSERVRRYAATLARAMGLPSQEVWKTEIGALLHDVGKIGIQDCILNKPGPLTDDEYEVMKSHPVKGANIMEPIQQLQDVIPVMKHHHERWDGGGYPDGLEAEEIPLSTRLVTIADCWDAMTTNRPYQKAMDLDIAVRRLESLSGRAFDPAVAEAFVACVQRGDLDSVMGDARRQVASTAADLDRIQTDEAATAVARGNTDPDCLPPAREVLQD